jgi:phage shock protein C
MGTKLYRNRKDKIIAGVCSGLSDYFDIDVVVMRLIFIVTALVWGMSVLVYIILWIITPVRPESNDAEKTAESLISEELQNENLPRKRWSSTQTKEILAIILIVVGVFATLDNLFVWLSGRLWLPMVLITLGLLILFYPKNEDPINEEASNEQD